MEERRRFPRFGCPKDKFCTVTSKGANSFLGNVKNISREGVAISSTNRLEPNKEVSLDINYADLDRHIPVSLKILWEHSGNVLHTYGAVFSRISPEDKFDILESFYEIWKNDETRKRRLLEGDNAKTWVR
ncbi:PilZ domain-containing protein [Candidatus Omnitrophota bacterium]